jgi:predicted DNA-binding ribbon-helix-helix protein
MAKSRDSRDRISVTFDIGQLRERLKAQAIEPSQSLASIVRMALLEWLEQREASPDKESENSQDSQDSQKSD